MAEVTGAPTTGPALPGLRPPRPADVDTGFWLWLAALPLMVTGAVTDLLTVPPPMSPLLTYAFSGGFLAVVAVLTATFLFLLRHGYRWARTVLTGGGVAAVAYTAMNLFSDARPPVGAVVYAVTGIVGSVLIVGGIVLLHRREADQFLSR